MTDESTPLKQAIALLQRGEAEAAMRAASDACHAAPDRREPHYAYGQAWLALNQPARAAEAFLAALRIDPGWADAWVNYGIARYRQGDVETAKTAMRRALRANPAIAAIGNLGGLMRISGEAPAANRSWRGARPRSGKRRRTVEPCRRFTPGGAGGRRTRLAGCRPVPADPAIARHWHLQRSLALLQLGRPGQAGMRLGAFAALGPRPPNWRHSGTGG